MNKLIAQLRRLYLPDGAPAQQVFDQPISLTTDTGLTRAIVIAFDKREQGEQGQHWQALCTVANALQEELGLPAPAVSISGSRGFRLWLSLEAPVPVARARQFVELLQQGMDMGPVELPPCLHQATGLWAAFINPGLGSSFLDESGLEMAPPFAGQAALLDGLKSITEAQLMHAMSVLQQGSAVVESAPALPVTPQGLLLKDATLDDIVKHLHSLNIEPTFRHLIGR